MTVFCLVSNMLSLLWYSRQASTESIIEKSEEDIWPKIEPYPEYPGEEYHKKYLKYPQVGEVSFESDGA